jgi:hypothetical protein
VANCFHECTLPRPLPTSAKQCVDSSLSLLILYFANFGLIALEEVANDPWGLEVVVVWIIIPLAASRMVTSS